jgi:hypothetical protein
MLKRELKRSSKYNEDGAMPVLLGKDLEKNLDDVDTKMEADAEDIELNDEVVVDEEPVAEEPIEDEIPPALDTDMEEPVEEFKDVNEKVVVYLYRGFAELGDAVRLFVEDVDNEERDPELVKTLEEFMEGYPEVMDVIKEMAKTYVTSVELFDPEEEEEITEEPAEDVEETDVEELEDDIEDAEVVESYIQEHNLEHNLFESEYEIYASYTSEEQATKYEEDFAKFKGAEVFRHEDIGEIHAFVRIK